MEEIITFETKPKSGVTEYVPSTAMKYLENHRDELPNFFNAQEGELAKRFLSNSFTKFHVMQINRKYKGKLKGSLSSYSPFDFFNSKSPDSLEKALSDLMSDHHIYGRLYINGTEERHQMTEARIKMISYFLRESKVI